jgi:outer membrane lipoprotein-sorting protein
VGAKLEIYGVVRCGLTPFALVAKLLSLTFRMQICLIKSVRNWTVLLTLSALACACGGKNAGVKTTKVIPPATRPVAKEATEEDLVDRYNALEKNVKALNATVELKTSTGSAYSGVINEYHEVKAFVLAARPSYIRMIGQVPVVGKTIFDMASDGRNFEVSIPPRNKFLEGPVALTRQSDKPIENLRPQHLLEALLWPEILKEEAVLIEESNDESARYYVLTVLRGGYKTEILRKVWFDRADLNVVRLQTYGPKGVLLSDVRYSDWQPVDAPSAGTNSATGGNAVQNYPRNIHIDRTRDEYQLNISVKKIVLNEPLQADRFTLAPPAGVEVVHVGDESKGQTP